MQQSVSQWPQRRSKKVVQGKSGKRSFRDRLSFRRRDSSRRAQRCQKSAFNESKSQGSQDFQDSQHITSKNSSCDQSQASVRSVHAWSVTTNSNSTGSGGAVASSGRETSARDLENVSLSPGLNKSALSKASMSRTESTNTNISQCPSLALTTADVHACEGGVTPNDTPRRTRRPHRPRATKHVQTNSLDNNNNMENIPSEAQNVLDYWFGGPVDEIMDLWFGKSSSLDAEITEKFGKLVMQAREGKLDHWAANVWSGLALVVLLDQFPRNMFRHQKEMYASDEKARHVVMCLLCGRGDSARVLDLLAPLHCVALCLVLTHAECRLLQNLCVNIWKLASKDLNDSDPLRVFDAIFQKHLDVIEKFGRFVHRDVILQRCTNEEEREFLSDDEFRFDLPLKRKSDGTLKFERTHSFKEFA